MGSCVRFATRNSTISSSLDPVKPIKLREMRLFYRVVYLQCRESMTIFIARANKRDIFFQPVDNTSSKQQSEDNATRFNDSGQALSIPWTSSGNQIKVLNTLESVSLQIVQMRCLFRFSATDYLKHLLHATPSPRRNCEKCQATQ